MFDFNDSDSDSSIATETQAVVALRHRHSDYVTPDLSASVPIGRSTGSSRTPDAHPVYFPVKYCCERVFATVALVAVSPLILALIVLVRLTSKGAGLYRQERVGLNQTTFDVFKLRTMRIDAEADGQAKWSQKGDPRITWLGRILRRTHLDELPQLWNVAAGDMSLTGPRPERPLICDVLQKHVSGYYSRTHVKPGITGLAQINLEPDSTISDVHRKQCLDMDYIQHSNIWLDLRMVFATVLRMAGIRGSHVNRWMGLCRKDVIESAGLSVSDCRGSETIVDLMNETPSKSSDTIPQQIPRFRFDRKPKAK